MGQTWPKILKELTGGGIAFGFDAETEGAIKSGKLSGLLEWVASRNRA